MSDFGNLEARDVGNIGVNGQPMRFRHFENQNDSLVEDPAWMRTDGGPVWTVFPSNSSEVDQAAVGAIDPNRVGEIEFAEENSAHLRGRLEKGYSSGLGVSIALHTLLVLGLSLLAVSPRGFVPTLNTTASFKDHDAVIDQIEFESLVDSIVPPTEVRTRDVSVTTLTQLFAEKRKPVKVKDAWKSRRSNILPYGDEAQMDLAAMSGQTGTTSSGSETAAAGGSNQKQGQPPSISSRVKAAGGESGKVQISLAWEDRNDLDLHVIAPSGERIFFHHKESECYAELDVDMNADPESEFPVENVHWPKSRAPMGRYTILVHFYRQHIPNSLVPYRLMVKRAGHSREVTGVANGADQFNVHRTFYIAPHIEGEERQRRIKVLSDLQSREERLAKRLLDKVLSQGGANRKLAAVVLTYPHTDSAIDAIRMLCSRKPHVSQVMPVESIHSTIVDGGSDGNPWESSPFTMAVSH